MVYSFHPEIWPIWPADDFYNGDESRCGQGLSQVPETEVKRLDFYE
jgi:hypothetical protein